jgi:hypothetical protein
VHRLDMDTSGVMVFALTPSAQRHLGLQFERRHVKKTYHARVWGEMAEKNRHRRPAAHRRLAQPAASAREPRDRETRANRLARGPDRGRHDARAPLPAYRALAPAARAHEGNRPPDPGRPVLRHRPRARLSRASCSTPKASSSATPMAARACSSAHPCRSDPLHPGEKLRRCGGRASTRAAERLPEGARRRALPLTPSRRPP